MRVPKKPTREAILTNSLNNVNINSETKTADKLMKGTVYIIL